MPVFACASFSTLQGELLQVGAASEVPEITRGELEDLSVEDF